MFDLMRCLTPECYKNIENIYIINYMDVHFLRPAPGSILADHHVHNYKFTAEDIARVFCHHDKTTLARPVTAKSSTNKKSRKLMVKVFTEVLPEMRCTRRANFRYIYIYIYIYHNQTCVTRYAVHPEY